MNRRLTTLLAVLLVVLAGGTVVVTTDDGTAPAPKTTPTATATPEETLPADASAKAPDGSVGDLASDLRDEPAVSGKTEGAAKTEELADQLAPRAPSEGDQAGQPIGPRCISDFSGNVFSDRAPGVRPTEFVLHYTVSANRPGTGDVRAIQAFFKNTRLGSAHYILDFEGNCLKMVPERRKAFTQGNANSTSLSIEIIATGSEPASAWKNAPIFKQRLLAGLVRRVMDRWGLPLVRVDPVGCVFVPGWTDHNHLECGNDHHDVAPHFPFRLFRRQLRAVR